MGEACGTFSEWRDRSQRGQAGDNAGFLGAAYDPVIVRPDRGRPWGGVSRDLGAMVLERLQPGTMLATLPYDEATAIAAGVMRTIWRPAPAEHRFPTVADWARELGELRETFGGSTGPFPPHLVEEAERLFNELVPTQTDPVILHDVNVGMKTPRQTVRMDFDQNMGELYPFSLRDKLSDPAVKIDSLCTTYRNGLASAPSSAKPPANPPQPPRHCVAGFGPRPAANARSTSRAPISSPAMPWLPS